MRAASTLCKIFMWITALVAVLFQCMAMWGIHINNSGLISLGKPEDQYNMLPLILATAGLAAAVALFSFLPRRLRFIGLILMGIVAVVFIPPGAGPEQAVPALCFLRRGGSGPDHLEHDLSAYAACGDGGVGPGGLDMRQGLPPGSSSSDCGRKRKRSISISAAARCSPIRTRTWIKKRGKKPAPAEKEARRKSRAGRE